MTGKSSSRNNAGTRRRCHAWKTASSSVESDRHHALFGDVRFDRGPVDRHGTEAYDTPVSKDELEQAAQDPNSGIYNAEFYVRIKREDKATEAFDRAHKDDPVISYFRTADWIANELNRLRALAPMAQKLGMTDFSSDRVLFSEACAKLTELEHTLMRIYGPASGKKTREN